MSGILVPVGGTYSDVAEDDEVVRLACTLGRQMRTTLCFLHVIQVPRTLAVDAELPAQTSRGDDILTRAEQEARRHNVKAETVLVQAREVGPAIVNEAMDRAADLIVIAMDPERFGGTFHVGRIASHVLEHASCAVVAHRQALA